MHHRTPKIPNDPLTCADREVTCVSTRRGRHCPRDSGVNAQHVSLQLLARALSKRVCIIRASESASVARACPVKRVCIIRASEGVVTHPLRAHVPCMRCADVLTRLRAHVPMWGHVGSCVVWSSGVTVAISRVITFWLGFSKGSWAHWPAQLIELSTDMLVCAYIIVYSYRCLHRHAAVAL